MKIKLAEALLRRKELNERLRILAVIKEKDLYEVKTGRKAAHEGLDDIIVQVPKLRVEEVMASYNYCSMQLRLVDAAIQQANWTTDIEVDQSVMKEFVPQKPPAARALPAPCPVEERDA